MTPPICSFQFILPVLLGYRLYHIFLFLFLCSICQSLSFYLLNYYTQNEQNKAWEQLPTKKAGDIPRRLD